MNKLKILQITPYYLPVLSGVVNVVRYLSEELVKRGHSVTVLTANRNQAGKKKKKYKKYEINNGVEIYRYNSILNLNHMSLCPTQIRHYKHVNYNIIHNHCYRHIQGDIASIFFQNRNIPFILHGHGPFLEQKDKNSLKNNIYKIYDKVSKYLSLKKAKAIIALTEYEKNKYLDIGVNNEKIIIIPNAVSNDCFLDYDTENFKNELRIKNKKNILFLSDLNPTKRPDLLIKALPKIINKRKDIMLTFVGPDGGMAQQLKYLAKSLNVDKYYQLVGPLDGKKKHLAYSSADIFCLPSDEESFGLVIIEAMAHGLPVICTKTIGAREIIQNNLNGILINKNSDIELSENILKILENEQIKEKLGKKARKDTENKYKIDHIVNKIEEVYCKLHENIYNKQTYY